MVDGCVVSSVVNGLSVLVGGPLGVTRVTGLSLLLGNPVGSGSSVGLSVSKAENGSLLFRGRPWLDEARGCSTGSGSFWIGRLARFPVGTILTLVRVRVPEGPVGPVGGIRPLSSTPGPVGTSGLSSSGVLPLIANWLPGKSSGTMGLPLTLEITGGGVTSSDPGINSMGVKFSVLNGLFVGLTRTTRTPVGPLRSSSASLLLNGSLVVTRGCLARGLVTSGCS